MLKIKPGVIPNRRVRPLAEVNYEAALAKLCEKYAPEWKRRRK